jgi:hypothetical protein
MTKGAEHLTAVVRIESHATVDRLMEDPNLFVTVKEVLPSAEEAEAKVARLNKLNAGKAIYFSQTTRYFPGGRRVGE